MIDCSLLSELLRIIIINIHYGNQQHQHKSFLCNKKYDEYEYMMYRKQTEIIVTIFYEGILRGTQYGNHPRTKYALKIHSVIEDLMNKDWSKVNETLK